MDPRRFDALVRRFAAAGSRRRLVAVFAAIPLIGVLAGLPSDEAAAEKPHEHLRRHKAQRRRKQRNRKQRNHKHTGNTKGNTNHGGGLGGPQACAANGQACQRNRDCCKGACFNQVCANTPNQCGGNACPPDATGCCTGNCCASPANQCNPQGECCAPNCSGRTCGADGCGGNGLCGTCPANSVCNPATGLCSCGPENCDGCCDENGVCQPGNKEQQCGGGGIACFPCGPDQYCSTETGSCRDNPPCSAETCPNGCCFEQENGFHVCRTDLRGCTPGGACCDGCCDANTVCQPGTDHGVCGRNGSACIICNPLDPLCDQGRCECDANNCPGCCSDGPGNPGFCQQGNTDDFCGFDGVQCAACPTGTTCAGQGACQCLNTDQFCGVGTNCVACPEGTACNEQGQCVCTAQSCPASSGRSCQNNQCLCDWTICQGCCQDGLCKPGDTAQACSTGASECTVCSAGDDCVDAGIFGRACCPDGSAFCGPGPVCCVSDSQYCCIGGTCCDTPCCDKQSTCCPGGADCCNDTCCPIGQPTCCQVDDNGTQACVFEC